MIFRASKNHNEHPPKAGEDKEQPKEFFDKKNGDKKPDKKPKDKSVINDPKSKNQFDKVRGIMKENIRKVNKPYILNDVFGYNLSLDLGSIAAVISNDDLDDHEYRQAKKRSKELEGILKTGDHEKLDQEFDKAVKEFDHKGRMKDRQIIAEAYNDYMEEETRDKSRKIYRFVHPVEVFDMLKTGLFKEIRKKKKSSASNTSNMYVLRSQSPPHKCWTIDKKHFYSDRGFRLESTIGDYDFQVLKATAYPRLEKTLKDGQQVDSFSLKEQELRLEIGKGTPIKKYLRIPKYFFSEMSKHLKGTDYTEENSRLYQRIKSQNRGG